MNNRVITLWLLYDMREQALVVPNWIKAERRMRAAAAAEARDGRIERFGALIREIDDAGARIERVLNLKLPRPSEDVLKSTPAKLAYLEQFRGKPFWHSILKIEEHVGDERKAGQQLAIGALSTIIYGLMKRHPDAWIGRLATIVLRASPIIDRREVQRARQAFLARHEST